jgi:transposase
MAIGLGVLPLALGKATDGERMRPIPCPVPTETARTVQALVTRRHELTKLVVTEQNRRTTADAVVRPAIDALLAVLTAQQRALDQQIAPTIAGDPLLAGRLAELTSVPGIGPVLGATLLVAVAGLGTTDGAPLAALVCFAPFARDSGAHRGHRAISGVRTVARRALPGDADGGPV